MASSARIDELRKKFDENPRRYFAPLANEYRKAGDLEQAIFICQEYLPQQPGHMSGHIVYGQALYEMGRHDEARAVFETALSLDPENLIALRHLGDIARESGDTDSARVWYQRVLEADPRNEEIAQIMISLLASPVERASAGDAGLHVEKSEESEIPAEPSVSTSSGLAGPDFEAVSDFDALSNLEAVSDSEVFLDSEAVPVSDGDVTEEDALPIVASASAAPEVDDGLLDFGDFSIGGLGVPVSAGESDDVLEQPSAADAGIDTASEEEPFEADPFAIAGASLLGEPESPDMTEPLANTEPPVVEFATDLTLGLADDSATVSNEPPQDAQIDGLETFESGFPTEEETVPASAFVTETMAQLYLEQGHLESAVDIYRQLVEQRPEDAHLSERLRTLTEQAHGAPASAAAGDSVPEEPASAGGPTIREFLSELVARRPLSVETPLQVADSEMSEGSVAADTLLTDMQVAVELDTERTAEPGSSRPSPSPSSDTVSGSIDVLFSGAERSVSDTPAASTFAEAFGPKDAETEPLQGVPAHRASSELSLDHVFKGNKPPKSDEDPDGFSFDQFFSEDATDSSRPGSEGGTQAQEPTDDIAQFHAWLNGLKKT